MNRKNTSFLAENFCQLETKRLLETIFPVNILEHLIYSAITESKTVGRSRMFSLRRSFPWMKTERFGCCSGCHKCCDRSCVQKSFLPPVHVFCWVSLEEWEKFVFFCSNKKKEWAVDDWKMKYSFSLIYNVPWRQRSCVVTPCSFPVWCNCFFC